MKRIEFICASLLAVILCGCATILSGTTQVLSFQSNPSGAEIIINGSPVGLTPLSVTVAKKSGTRILVKKEGYREQSFVLMHKIEPWFWGNIIFGGLIGSTTDIATGATVEYSPDQYYTTLEPSESAKPEKTMGVSETPKNKVIRYILVNYNAMAAELNSGTGNHVEALLQLLSISPDKHEKVVQDIKQLFVKNESISGFAEEVADKYGK